MQLFAVAGEVWISAKADDEQFRGGYSFSSLSRVAGECFMSMGEEKTARDLIRSSRCSRREEEDPVLDQAGLEAPRRS